MKAFRNMNSTLLFTFFILIVVFLYLFFSNSVLEGARGKLLRKDVDKFAINYLKGLGYLNRGLTDIITLPVRALDYGFRSIFPSTPYLHQARDLRRKYNRPPKPSYPAPQPPLQQQVMMPPQVMMQPQVMMPSRYYVDNYRLPIRRQRDIQDSQQYMTKTRNDYTEDAYPVYTGEEILYFG